MTQKGVSRFFGATSREALRQVRLALGPEALIIANRRVNGGVEIIAADPTEALEHRPPASSERSAAPVLAGAQHDFLEQQLSSLRRELSGQMDALLWGDTLRAHVPTFVVYQRLLALGLSAALARRLLMHMPRDLDDNQGWQWVVQKLHQRLPIHESLEQLLTKGATLALVGPTGVGKTTTLAKLAYQCVQMYGAKQVALISTDSFRVGAHEQLKIYAQLLQVPISIVHNASEFRQALLSHGPETVVLIDSVGVSQRDELVQAQANLLYASGRVVQRLLVLSAASSGETLDEVVRAYKTDGGRPLQGCVVTKLDEATTLGGIVDVAIRYQLPIAFATNGQRVPEDIILPNEAMGARFVPDEPFQSSEAAVQFRPSVADMAALARHRTLDELAAVESLTDPRQRSRHEALLQLLQPWGSPLSQRLDLADVQQVLQQMAEDIQWQFWSEHHQLTEQTEEHTFEQRAQAFLQALWAQTVRRLVSSKETVFFFHDHFRAPRVWHTEARVLISHAWTQCGQWQGPFFVQQFSAQQHIHFPSFRRDYGPQNVGDPLVAAAHVLPQATQQRHHIHIFSDYSYTRLVSWLNNGFPIACLVPAATACYDGQAHTTVGALIKQSNWQPFYLDADISQLLMELNKGQPLKINYTQHAVLLGRHATQRQRVHLLAMQLISAHDDELIEQFAVLVGGGSERPQRDLIQALLVFFAQRPIKAFFQKMLAYCANQSAAWGGDVQPKHLYLQALAGVYGWRLAHEPHYQSLRALIVQLWGERAVQAAHIPHTLERLLLLQRVLAP